MNSTRALGFNSKTNPCPDVLGENQLPEYAKSALVERACVVEHVTFGVSRVSGIEPLRFDPSLNAYDMTAASQADAVNVTEPTISLCVTGGAAKLPPTLR